MISQRIENSVVTTPASLRFRALLTGSVQDARFERVTTVRLGICASAVKYEWLGPLMLQSASNASQLDYGGRETVDAKRLYAERGVVLAFLASWAEEARTLAEELGLTC